MATSVAVPASDFNAAFSNVPNLAAPYALGDISGLTLANGMTAGYGVPSAPGGLPGDTANPPMAFGAYGGNPKWNIQRIGVLRNVPGTLPSAGAGFYSLYFYFNPNQINVSFTMNGQSTPPIYLYGAGNNGLSLGGSSSSIASQVPNLTNSQTVAWSLIFDRTYDFFRDQDPELDRGVLKDVAALYNLMGTFESAAAVPVSTPVQVVFGMTRDGQLWGFTGYISMVNITYGIFRRNMIPSRCEVDLQLTAIYVSSQVPAVVAGDTAPSTAVGNGGTGANISPIPTQNVPSLPQGPPLPALSTTPTVNFPTL
jgi:hypothetical protein